MGFVDAHSLEEESGHGVALLNFACARMSFGRQESYVNTR